MSLPLLKCPRRPCWKRAAAVFFLLAVVPFTPARAQDRALIVAIDSYAEAKLAGLPASLARNDAAAIETLLTEKLGYKREDVKVLSNEQATREAILTALDKWLNPLDPEEAVRRQKAVEDAGAKGIADPEKVFSAPERTYRSYFYFAGIGHFRRDTDGDEKDGLDETLVPYDATVTGAEGGDRIGGVITDDEFAAALRKFVGRHVTLVFDTGHSGYITRNRKPDVQELSRTRIPRIGGSVRGVSEFGRIEEHKSEGPFVDPDIPHGSLTVWSATSPTQTALVAGEDARPQGLFTLLYLEGLAEGKADSNGNGIISNAELLRHVSDGSAAYCLAFNERCEMGLRPRLDPPAACGRPAWVDRTKVSHARERQLTLDRLKDFLGSSGEGHVAIKQVPPSPLHVGDGDIRYEVYGPVSGYIVLLNLTDKGALFQLYPNRHAGKSGNGLGGSFPSNPPLVVPDKSWGVTYSATEPAKGHIVSVVTSDPVRFGISVTGRPIASVSADELIDVYLARLTAALHHPVNADSMQANTRTARWSVNVLPYEILP